MASNSSETFAVIRSEVNGVVTEWTLSTDWLAMQPEPAALNDWLSRVDSVDK